MCWTRRARAYTCNRRANRPNSARWKTHSTKCGANLLNKAGHEALGKERTERNGNVATTDKKVQYRRYPDEPLNPRIVNPVLQGNTLIATIDHVPCTVQLNSTVADAYRAGALPLNTLANAVLVQSDRLRQMASQNYDNGQQETIVRTRGIQ